uniref:Pentatricopeptide repeat-containing protein n=1 Tax=Ananas comosus var. bracteatus TaxID=296719 RepID=A0A6V7NFZ1_ANACO|nr:unnamed protein product [Ananas comosus var. bracteatus]
MIFPFLQSIISFHAKSHCFSNKLIHLPLIIPHLPLSFSAIPNHSQIVKLGLSNDMFSQNNLLTMYSKSHLLCRAGQVFDEMTDRNVVSWTCMITGSIQNGECEMGFRLFRQMLRVGFYPNEFALASVVSACESYEEIKFGVSLHSIALKLGIDRNPYVGSSVLLMYAKNRDTASADIAFECIFYRDLACWNSMVESYVLNGYGYNAMRTVCSMHRKGLVFDQFTFLSAIKGCLISKDLNYARQIHCLIIQNRFESYITVMNSLTDLYFTLGVKDVALKVFDNILEKDVVSWNTLISAAAQEEDEIEAMGFFSSMLSTGLKPNHVTFSVILRMCAVKEQISLGLQFFCLACRSGYSDNVLVANSVVDLLSKCGFVNTAYHFFRSIPARNLVTWNEMISGYGLNGYSKEAFQLFRNLLRSNIRGDEFTYSGVLGACKEKQDSRTCEQIHGNIIKSGFASYQYVCTSLVKAYSMIGLVGNSFRVFEEVGELDLVSWGVIISAFVKRGLFGEALSLVNCLREEGQQPDEFILANILNACCNATLIIQCRCIHSHVVKTGHEKHFCVASAVIDAYAKCGDIISSKMAFDNSSVENDAILYNTMITAYAHHGLIKEALELHEQMRRANVEPTQATFVAVISACNHLGLVEQGKYIFNSISYIYGMRPTKDHFLCLIDLLARNGLLEEAKAVIESMPYEPWPAAWRSLLNGCRIHGNKEMGEIAAQKILKLVPHDDGVYVLLSNIYAEDGSWECAEKIRIKMEERRVQKVPGYSMIEI